MTAFLTVKEAAQLIGKSPSSIRRIIYPMIEDDGHPDRDHIRPTVSDVAQLRIKGENFAWKVSDELLRREAPAAEAATKSSSSSHAATTASNSDALIDMLRRELAKRNSPEESPDHSAGRTHRSPDGTHQRAE